MKSRKALSFTVFVIAAMVCGIVLALFIKYGPSEESVGEGDMRALLWLIPTRSTPPPPVDEGRIIQEAADAICLGVDAATSPQLEIRDPEYRFFCAMAAGHGTDAAIHRYPREVDAQTAFLEAAGDQPVQSFHGCPFSHWQEEHPYTGESGSRRIGVWRADRWLVRVQSDDDTHYLIAADPAAVSETIYNLASQYALFACEE